MPLLKVRRKSSSRGKVVGVCMHVFDRGILESQLAYEVDLNMQYKDLLQLMIEASVQEKEGCPVQGDKKLTNEQIVSHLIFVPPRWLLTTAMHVCFQSLLTKSICSIAISWLRNVSQANILPVP